MTVTVGPYRVEEGYEDIIRFCLSTNIMIDLMGGDDPVEGPTFIDRNPYASIGPAGGACDIVHRVVWADELASFELLHEVMHVFLAVPFLNIEEQPLEHELLMPIERRYAEKLLSKEQYDACVNWQERTLVGLDMELSEYDKYERKRWWTRGLTLGRHLGVLSKENKPTFAVPDWNAPSLRYREYLCRQWAYGA